MFGVTLPTDYLRMALRLAPYAAIIGLVIALLIVINQRDAAKHDLEIMLAEVSRKVAEAKAADEAHARESEQLQQKVTNDVSKDYQARLADARARADGLRAQLARGGGKQGVSSVSSPSGGPDAATGGHGLSLETAVSLMLAADENTEKLIALQRWVRQQQALSEEHR